MRRTQWFRILMARWRSWRRRRQVRGSADPLREFIYLDEVSVYSLLASRLGPIATEFSSTETLGLTSGVTAGGSAFGVSGQTTQTTESASHVVRKAIVQSAFRDLIEGLGQDLSLLPAEGEGRALSRSASTLKRGTLLELAISLEADDTYKLSSVIGAVSGVLDSLPDQVTPDAHSGLEAGMAVNELLEKLTLGLIPIRARVLGVRADGDKILQSDDPALGETLYAVANTQADKYWRDTRLVLFGGKAYRMLCRLASDGFVDDWSSITLRPILSQIFPDLDAPLGYFESQALGDLAKHAAAKPAASEHRDGQAVAIRFVERLCRHVDIPAPPHIPLPSKMISSLESLDPDQRREAFDRVAALALGDRAIELSPEQKSEARRAAMATPDPPEAPSTVVSQADVEKSERMLQVEVIAIYW